ncbi:PREDICTED: protocadherin Fat 4-like [Chaetura pelagica]|uniref:protocadherin Fat 4-like n=1 Tax=Chaetura pelagica TaxID=8897 RepID=UPI000523733F|nr:PREDICTED: protocadherin Fat 4-like [Chaetura pelagica]
MESVSLQRPAWKWQVLSLFSLWGWVSGQIRYSVVEESEVGTVVGNVARDLGLKVEELPGRRLRLGSEESLSHFAVRLDSGELVVSQQLDRERLCGAAASCVLSVQVVTENPLQLFRLEVEILDLNDNSPSFPTAHRSLRVAESATVATRFPLESAQDPDVGTNAVGFYRLSPNSHFSLDVKQQQDGKLFPELVLERALDREEQPELQLVLTAMDGGSPPRSGTAQITVLVLDVNDNAPTFDRSTYKVQVLENTPVGALLLQLNASDPDEGPNGETQYSFGVHTSDSVRRLFTLDPHSGEVRVKGALDFEESASYEIYVRVHDGGVPEMEGHCVLQVEVVDVNDNPPEVLLTSLLNPVPEDTPPATVIGLFNVRDRDAGANGDVSLEISPNVPFTIKSLQNHFSLVTRESLDRESTSQYVVELVAQDGGSPALTTTLTLLLNISDVNDNPPHFLQPSYDAFLPENNPPGSLLCTVSASDPDDGDNSRLVYSIESSQYFSVNVNTGVIMVSERIDREQLCGQNPRCFLHLKLAIENPVEFYRIEVEILDVNDNPPEFPSDEVSLRIYELASLGARFPIQPAQDPDVGTNTLQTYHLSANENFNLNVKARTDGGKFPELVLEKALDRELRAFHHLVLTAEDGGSPPQSSKIRITIQVLDANDNHPVFDRPSYGARLVENSPLGTLVVKLNATDVDEGPNGEIRYSLSSHNSATLRQIFAIDEQTGEIRVQGNLDFEEATVYEIEVEAKDMGSPTMEEHCSVLVEITDVNDNAPEVILTSFSSSLSEDAPPGTVVAVIHVRDRDSGDQGKVQCHVPPDLPFRLRKDYEHQYSLLTSTRLDREHVAYYNVTISASDLGSPPLSRYTTLPITLTDVNDNVPQFEQASYEVLVAENNPVGSVLVTVSATDPDSEQNSRLSYSILRAGGTDPGLDPTRYLSIHPTSGQVSAKLPFDYEQTTYLQFHVEVSDGGSPALRNRTLVHVFIVDQNDNAPQVHFPRAGEDSATQFHISPSITPPALITKVMAIDADSGRNAWLSYHLMEATDPGLFSVALRSGEIRITRVLQETDPSAHELQVVVRDAGDPPLSAAITLVVLVEEKGPEALQGSEARATDVGGLPTVTLYLIVSLVLISTVSLVGLAVLGVRCLRKGSAPANQGCCVESVNTLQPPPSHIFGHLHYEPKQGDTVMGVQVTATAPPAPRYRSCFSPVSDITFSCLPAPSSSQLRYSVPEDREPGSWVGDLAKDLGVDLRSLATRSLRLVSEGGQRHFKVDLAAGVLLLDSRLDREALCGQSPTCSLHLQLVMEHPLQLHRVEVDVLDVNDNAPQFPKPEVVLEITEVANPGTRLPLEVAEDPDMGSNSISTYELSPSQHFALSINVRGDGVKMPEIVLEKALDREKVAVHHLTLTALDGGNPVKSGTAKVTIHVLDANDNPPVCDPPVSKVHLEENVPVGTLVTKLNVTDLDEGPNGDVEYSFKVSNNAPGKFTKLFSLDPRTGEIRTKAPLDYEESSAYEIAVRARDKGSPAMEGHCHLRVELIDINDNSPEIVLTSLSSPVQEDATPGTVIALIGVKDSDSGDNGQVRLQITKELPFKLVSSFKEHFSLVTNGPLDREKASGYNITVRAVDSGFPQRATQKTFYLGIADVNDNAPNFSSPFDTAHVQENSLPGTSVFSVSAFDPDEGSNAKLSYSILDNGMQDVPISAYFRIDQDNGTIYTMRALDYEQDKVFQVPVEVKDAGSPVLSSTAVVHVFVLDENDNAPTIVYPPVPKGSAFHQTIPVLAEPGYLVTKIVAVDADSGHNAWLSYQLQESAEALPFQVERRSGEIRQAQPNTDWRFSQTQRPGTSGSQNGEEGGAWPNNQFDTEMLQAMILASANEAADANATLGGGTGTMGLSARYGPQFTLQHVPDYRQNVYIPGSTATLTNAAGKRDAKATNPSGGNKKKSGKKEKK